MGKAVSMRILGLDYGDKTVGVAISDPAGAVACGLETIRRDNPDALRPSVRRLQALAAAYGVGTIVLGFPKRLDGGQGVRCEKTLRFKEKLERNIGKSVPVVLWDERFSTRAVLRAGDGTHVDEMAAVYILQGYLDYKRRT